MLYEVKIEDQDGEEVIYIGNPENEGEGKMITSLVVELDTINDQSRQKSNAMLAKLEIVGLLDSSIKGEIIKLFNWAKEQNEEKWYRNIEIKVKTSNDNVDRIYNFENVFILDYSEVYTDEADNKKDYFKVKLTQKENNFKKIATF